MCSNTACGTDSRKTTGVNLLLPPALHMKIVNIVGARPNFVKIAPIMDALNTRSKINALLVHTGQHYDSAMSDLFFRQLHIPEPDLNLGVGSGSHAAQTAEIMKSFESVVLEHKPDTVLARNTQTILIILDSDIDTTY